MLVIIGGATLAAAKNLETSKRRISQLFFLSFSEQTLRGKWEVARKQFAAVFYRLSDPKEEREGERERA